MFWRWEKCNPFQWKYCENHSEQICYKWKIYISRACESTNWGIQEKANLNSQPFLKILYHFQLQVTAKRCDFNMSLCENFNAITIPDLCKLMAQKNKLWDDLIAHMKPPPRCPINTAAIEISNATMDLSYIGYLPIAGYNWISAFKLFKSITNIRHKKHLLFCIMFESTVAKSQRGEKRHVHNKLTGSQ